MPLPARAAARRAGPTQIDGAARTRQTPQARGQRPRRRGAAAPTAPGPTTGGDRAGGGAGNTRQTWKNAYINALSVHANKNLHETPAKQYGGCQQ